MKWRTHAFVDPQSAANAAREWFLEQQTLADWEGDEDFGKFTDAYDPATKGGDSDVVLHTRDMELSGSLRCCCHNNGVLILVWDRYGIECVDLGRSTIFNSLAEVLLQSW